MTVLTTAARLRSQYPDVHFQFYSSDAIDVLELLMPSDCKLAENDYVYLRHII